MGRPKGTKKTGGKDFQPSDPRINRNGAPKADVRVTEIKSELKTKIAESLKQYYDLPVSEISKMANDPTMTIGKRISLRFLAEASNKGDPARISLLAKLVGLEVSEHNITVSSLESLIVASKKEDEE